MRKPAGEAAGFEALCFHDLRHSAAPVAVDMGANLLQTVVAGSGTARRDHRGDVYGDLFQRKNNDAATARLDHGVAQQLTPTSGQYSDE